MKFNQNYLNKDEVQEVWYEKLIIGLVFFAGVLNSQDYLSFMGYNNINQIILIISYVLLFTICFILCVSFLYKKKGKFISTFPYWLLLVIAIALKFFILFVQFPSAFLPGGNFFSFLLNFTTNVLILIILIKGIHTERSLKKVIFALGLGVSFSAIIPFLFFPEMIGRRMSLINDYHFSGAFWNSAVISYISVGWLLVALSIDEKSKIKRVVLILIFILLISAGLAGLSRAALLSVTLSTITYLLLSKKFFKYIKIVLLLIVVSFLLVKFFPEPIESFSQRLDSGINIEDEARTMIWKDYIKNIPDYFFFGEIEGNYKKYSSGGYGPHSVLLNWFTQFGILGILGFLTILFGLLVSIENVRRNKSNQIAAALYAWLIGYLSVAIINETGFNQLTVFISLGLILTWGNKLQKD